MNRNIDWGGEDSSPSQLAALLRDSAFTRIGSIARRFNIFDALRISNYELRHSDLLAFLLDPNQTHNLGDRFLRGLIRKLLRPEIVSDQVLAVQLELSGFTGASVFREWHNIDILVLVHDPQCPVSILIENKIGSTEHSNQLARYKADVKRSYPEYRLLPVFLTMDRSIASDDDYLSIGYDVIGETMDECFPDKSSLPPDVSVLITHYREMLREKSDESELRKLCEQVYQKHGPILDKIFEYRPDKQSDVSAYLQDLVKGSGLILDDTNKRYIRFCTEEWDDLRFKVAEWTKTNRLLLFEFNNDGLQLTLNLYVGPSRSPFRDSLIATATEAAKQSSILHRKSTAKKWRPLYTNQFLSRDLYAEPDFDTLKDEIQNRWAQFMKNDLPILRRALTIE